VSGDGSLRNGEAGGDRVAVVAPQQDLLFTQALAKTLAVAVPTVDDALHMVGFERAIQSCRLLRPSVIVIVLQRSYSNDVIQFADDLRRTCPDCRLVVIADDDEDVVSAVEAGAVAVVPRSRGLQALVDAIRTSAAGETQIDAEKLRRAMLVAARRRLERADIAGRLGLLTEREDDVLRLVAEGARNKAIASALHISARTVDTHITNVLRKLRVHSKLEAAALLSNASVSSRGPIRDSAYAETRDPPD
jgi:two-component system nitrate/nitrite response regulator NarL